MSIEKCLSHYLGFSFDLEWLDAFSECMYWAEESTVCSSLSSFPAFSSLLIINDRVWAVFLSYVVITAKTWAIYNIPFSLWAQEHVLGLNYTQSLEGSENYSCHFSWILQLLAPYNGFMHLYYLGQIRILWIWSISAWHNALVGSSTAHSALELTPLCTQSMWKQLCLYIMP